MSASPIPKTAPFADDEIEVLNRVVGPATAVQRAWLAGFLAGLDASSGAGASAAQPAIVPQPAEPLTILYATESGNAEGVAANARKVLETGESEECEYRIIRPSDRQERWIWTVWGASQDPFSGAKRLVGIALDITERKRNEERELLLSREVDHRAKNLLSVVQSMVQLTRADSIPEFVDQVKGRIHALGRVHSLLAASRWEGAELSKLIEEELAAFADDGDRLRLEGPLVALRPAAAQSMALVIHELATNAAKYGALSVVGGHVEVIWDAGETVAGGLVLRWRENEGPPVVPPEQTGFGMKSIRASIERQLGGTLDLQWHPEGLQCELVLPSRQLVPG